MSFKRILVFNVNWLGDVLFSTPLIRNIRYNFPKSYIACAIPPRVYEVLKGNPHIDELILFDERERQSSFGEKLNFVRLLKFKRFEVVFLLHRSFTRAFLCWLAGIPNRIGYSTFKRKFLLTQKISPVDRDSLHRIDYYLNIIEKAGLKVYDRYLEFFVEEKDIIFVEELLKKHNIVSSDFLVGINPGGNWLPKRWPKEYWAELIDKLIREFSYKVIITGGAKDLSLAEEIKSLTLEKPFVFAGKLTLKQFASLCKRLDLFISADSGPLHIANTMKTKRIIALFGPTSLVSTAPYPLERVKILKKQIPCKIPCYNVNCKDNQCMKLITPHDVIEKIKEFNLS